MPGARYGIGDATYVKRAGAARLTFALGAAEWLPPGDPRAPRLTASLVKGDLYRVDTMQPFLLGDPPRAEVHREPGPVRGLANLVETPTSTQRRGARRCCGWR